MNEPELAKLSDAADQCGIPAGVLKITATYDLLPQVVRGRGGQFALERLAIVRYHGAYLDALSSEGRFQKEA